MDQELQFDINLPDVALDMQGQTEFQTVKAESKKKLAADKADPEKKNVSAFGRACGCFTIAYWSDYFDIDQTELKERLMACLNPKSSLLVEKVHQKPDLYGPFWICTTLIFCLTISESLSTVLSGLFTTIKDKKAEFDFTHIGLAITVVYGAFFIFPLIFILANKVFGSSIPVIKSASIYGYSFFVFILASGVSILPIPFLRTLSWLVAGAHSIIFLFFNFREYYEAYVGNTKLVVVSLIALTQIFLTCVFLMKFY